MTGFSSSVGRVTNVGEGITLDFKAGDMVTSVSAYKVPLAFTVLTINYNLEPHTLGGFLNIFLFHH